MNFCEFLESLSKAEFKSEMMSALLTLYATNIPSKYDGNIDEASVENLIWGLSDEAFSSFSSKLTDCLTICSNQLESAIAGKDYQRQVKLAEGDIKKAIDIYDEIASEKYNQKQGNNAEDVITVIETHDKKLAEINDRIGKLNEAVEDAGNLIDNKIFSLLINTVGILGIFVAIAFTGFSTFSLFQNIDFEVAFASKATFLKSVFFILLVGWLSYNLLLLLVYFIFKLSRPILDKKNIKKDGSDHGGKERFRDLVSLSRFLWIDGILFALVVLMFFVSCATH